MKSEYLMHIQFSPERSLQEQIREHILEAIRNGIFADNALPSCRKLASMLKVSRNTVVLAYDQLVEQGYLISQQRSGYYPSPEAFSEDHQYEHLDVDLTPQSEDAVSDINIWNNRLKHNLSDHRKFHKEHNWQSYPYPFLFGQPDYSLFPIQNWRECCRLSQRSNTMKDWISDAIDHDDSELLKQLQTNVLTKRGICAKQTEILVTIGTQNSLYLLAKLLVNANTSLGVEDPGYPDVRNIFALHGANIVPINLDRQGIEISEELKNCDYVYVTPSHQVPTNVTMSMKRRKALLKAADEYDFIVIEDDYESEINVVDHPLPSLKSLDTNGRVIYIGSLSKSLSPGLRIGYMVADVVLISAARSLRRLMYRHPPANNQRTCALFISLGHYDTYLRKLKTHYHQRWTIMRDALQTYLPQCITSETIGGSAFWLKLPPSIDCETFAQSAKQLGVLIEPGYVHFIQINAKRRCFIRMGYSSIASNKIELGIKKLASLLS